MAVVTKPLPRVFDYEGTQIPDPSPSSSPEDCLKLLAHTYPALNNAALDGPSYENSKQVFQVKVAGGTKG